MVLRPWGRASGVANLEDMTVGARVSGVLPGRVVEVVQVEWYASAALTLTYRDDAGRLAQEVLY